MKKGYTLIELIMAIVIMGVLLTVLASTYNQIVVSVAMRSNIAKAIDLSRMEFSIVNSISYSDATLANGYNTLTNNYQGSGYDLRRTVTYKYGSDVDAQSLKSIVVTIYSGGNVILSTETYRAKNVTYAP